jgi:hypothetical protein
MNGIVWSVGSDAMLTFGNKTQAALKSSVEGGAIAIDDFRLTIDDWVEFFYFIPLRPDTSGHFPLAGEELFSLMIANGLGEEIRVNFVVVNH